MIDFRVAVDTGGTFTDFVFLENGILNVHKLPSTPSNPALAIIEGITEKNIHDRPIDLIHGSTVATNALLSRDGVKVGLITNTTRLSYQKIQTCININDYFNFVITVNEAKEPKPSPLPYLQAMESLSLHPNETIIIEDSFQIVFN